MPHPSVIGQTPAFDQRLSPRFPVVPKAWPPQAKRRWRLGRRSRCPKFFARYRSQNFDRCHSFLLAFSAAGGARKRPRFAKRYRGTRGDHPPVWDTLYSYFRPSLAPAAADAPLRAGCPGRLMNPRRARRPRRAAPPSLRPSSFVFRPSSQHPPSSTIHPPPPKKQSPAPALSCRGGAPFLLGSVLRANFLYWISMLVFLGRTFWAALGTDTCRMPFSKLAWMSSGITLSPT